MMTVIVLIHAASTWMMVGLIWFVQIVHYPLFARVGAAQFAAYAGAHSHLTTLVVAGPMVVEAMTAVFLVWYRPAALSPVLVWSGLGLVVTLWLSTAFLQVPQHERLANGFDVTAYQFLVSSNWLRTIGWSVRGCIAMWMLHVISQSTAGNAPEFPAGGSEKSAPVARVSVDRRVLPTARRVVGIAPHLQ